MTKEEIFNNYAIEQGYESWYDFACNYKSKGYSTHSFLKHQNKVTDLIQEELKKKVSVIALDSLELYNSEYEILLKAILNTEIL